MIYEVGASTTGGAINEVRRGRCRGRLPRLSLLCPRHLATKAWSAPGRHRRVPARPVVALEPTDDGLGETAGRRLRAGNIGGRF